MTTDKWLVTMPERRKTEAVLREEALVIMGIFMPGRGRTEINATISPTNARKVADLLESFMGDDE